MKKILLLALGVAIASCNSTPKDGYKVSVQIKNLEDGTVVYLKGIDENNQPINKDTTEVKSGSFTFEGKAPEVAMHFISITGISNPINFFLENGTINIEAHRDSLFAAKVSGTLNNDKLAEYKDGLNKFQDKSISIRQDLINANKQQDEAAQKALRDELQELQQEGNAYNLQFIKDNPKSVIAGILIGESFRYNSIPMDTVKVLLANLDESVKKLPQVKKITDYIKTKEENDKKAAIGTKAPEFSGPNPEGKTVALKEVLGKVTIIDFWAAWCKPCRRENPNVVKIYKQYHSKGLNIVGVSLDRTKEDWVKAIEKDGLEWTQISNLAYFNDEIAKAYNVNAIPATFILDEEGNIVAKNLRGKALEDKIASMLK